MLSSILSQTSDKTLDSMSMSFCSNDFEMFFWLEKDDGKSKYSLIWTVGRVDNNVELVELLEDAITLWYRKK